MTYNGTLVVPSSCAVMDTEEMTYIEGGGTARVTIKGKFSANLIKAVYSTGVGVAVALISGGICALLGVSTAGSILIPAAIGAVANIITSYALDTRNIKARSFSKSVSSWFVFNVSLTINIGTIGW